MGQPDSDERQQIHRERRVFLYAGAITRGDFDLVGAILEEAEEDPVLERMVLDLNGWLEADTFADEVPQSEEEDLFAELSNPSIEQPTLTADLADVYVVYPAADQSHIDLLPPESTEDDLAEYPISSPNIARWPLPLPVTGITGRLSADIESLLLLATLHLTMEHYFQTVQCLDKALKIALEVNDHEAIGTCAYWHATMELLRGNYTRARSYCRLGLLTATEAKEEVIQFDQPLEQLLRSALAYLVGLPPTTSPILYSMYQSELPRVWGSTYLF